MNAKKYNFNDLKKSSKKDLLKTEAKPAPEEKAAPAQKKKNAKGEGRGKKKLGPPFKSPKEKLDKKVTVNFTVEEFQTLTELSQQNFDVPLSKLIRSLLKKQKII